jgi:hypothetical protein
MLTVPQATSQARRHVDKIMPGVMATVDSRLSHDMATDTPTVTTTVTFPAHIISEPLQKALAGLPGVRSAQLGPAGIRLVRAR